mmetsp:Transcript_14468/g.15971  ORF Transcript_14468/g.15971 Transcript_14468/m.15971 type:complete len:184 (-) Transcript_14468:616-1167(-)
MIAINQLNQANTIATPCTCTHTTGKVPAPVVKETLTQVEDLKSSPAVKKLPGFKRSKCRKTKGKTTGEFKCRYLNCSQAFSNRFNLKRHVMLVHSRSRTFYCRECDRSFGLLQNYRDHLLLHLSFQEVEEKMSGISPSVTERLPMFMVENTSEEDLLTAYIDFKPLARFVEHGLLPHPHHTQH